MERAVTDMLPLMRENLLTPPILFFLLGVVARVLRSDLEIPREIARILSIYLLIAIGFKGGAELAKGGWSVQVVLACVAVVVLGAVLTVLAFGILRTGLRLSGLNAATIAAHYGSVSAVTFITGVVFLERVGAYYEGFTVALMALMESPAIFVGILLARWGEPQKGPTERVFSKKVLQEALFNGSVVVLTGGLVIGAVTGARGVEMVHPFLIAPFQGVLVLFLLDMGLLAAARMLAFRRIPWGLIAFGLGWPLIGGGLGLLVASLLRLSPGGALLVMILGASGSYIAVPAALHMGLPRANVAYGVTLALAVTFPLNISIGIPLYFWVARLFIGG
jgi:hypothetical protein